LIEREEMEMNKKQRWESIVKGEIPDYMPVWPLLPTHGVYSCGWRLPDITDQYKVDSEKSAQTVLVPLKKNDSDIILGSYFDLYMGMGTLGGVIKIPDRFGGVVGAEKYPVDDPLDWPEVKKRFATVFEKDGRIKGALGAIKIVAREVGDKVPIAARGNPGATAVVYLLRNIEAFTKDMIRDPKFAYELCEYANNFTIDFIRRQYNAGANSFTLLGDVFGTEMTSPQMYEKFGLPFVAQVVDVVKKEFKQDVFIHIHGDFRKPKANKLLDILVNEIGVKGLHLDQHHDTRWIKENVADKYKIPTAIIYHGPDMFAGPEEKIAEDVKEMIPQANPNYCYMAPSCEAPPDVPENHMKTWVQKTHEYSAEFYKGKR
jgi:uroporphyrinogen-III decarboxylase